MFGYSHFQALKNNLSVDRHNFFVIFYIFNFFRPGPGENQQKGKEVSNDFLCDLGP